MCLAAEALALGMSVLLVEHIAHGAGAVTIVPTHALAGRLLDEFVIRRAA